MLMLHNPPVASMSSLMQAAPSPLTDDLRRWTSLNSLGLHDDTETPPPDDGFADLVDCAAQLTDCPIAVIHLIGDTRHWVLAQQDPGGPSLPTLNFCRHALRAGNAVFEVADATQDTRFANDPLVTGATALRFYAAAPLLLDGVGIGTLCVAAHAPRALQADQHLGLQRLARLAGHLLRGRQRLVAVHAERERLLDLARSSGDWMWETDAELRYTWVSGSFEAITGLPTASVEGQPIDDTPLLDELGQPLGNNATFHSLLRQHQTLTRIVTAEHTPRGLLQISRSAVPVFDGRGRFAGYRGTARDVSAHIASERQTHAQAELLRKLSAQVPGVIFQFRLFDDHTVSYLYASDAAREVLGAEPPRDGDGGDPMAMCRLMHPDDEPGFVRSLIEAALTLQPWHRECRILRDGQVRWFEIRAVPETHPDGGTLWHGFSADITSRKEIELALRRSEERWSMAAEAAGIGIAQLAWPSGRLCFDARACANHGLAHPQNNFTLDDWVARIHVDDRGRAGAAMRQALLTGGSLDARYRVLHPDGGTPTLEIFARCTRDAQGAVTGMVGTCRDVTQQVALEQLRGEKEMAERANRAKSEFLSRVSHELRTPLNGILGFAQLMALDQTHPLADDQSRRLDNVLRAGRHLLELINDVLNLARIEQQDFSLQKMPVDLAATVGSVVTLMQPQSEAARVRVIVTPAEPLWAEADPRAVEQVLLNLLSNAIKYNRPQGVVRVCLARTETSVQVAVTDEGEGFTLPQQALLFQPFNRFGADERRVEGSGLGLVIARELAISMQGELHVDSRVHAGSTFTLSLPPGAPGVSGATAPPATMAPRLAAPAPVQRQVLYIEDEPLNVLLMQEVFKTRPEWRLHVAITGTEGLAMARAQAHDLLLVDMNLPDMNGLQLIRQLRTDASLAGQHCVALSADAMQAQIDAALAAGYDGYWTKPINISRILDALAQMLPR